MVGPPLPTKRPPAHSPCHLAARPPYPLNPHLQGRLAAQGILAPTTAGIVESAGARRVAALVADMGPAATGQVGC